MKKVFKATVVILLLVLLATVYYPTGSFAESIDSIQGVDKEYVRIKDFDDLQNLTIEDELKYQERLDRISLDLKRDFDQFISNEGEKFNLKKLSQESHSLEMFSIDEMLDAFLQEYPEYKKMDRDILREDIELLSYNPVVIAVRQFFSYNDYDLSLALFNHSLTSNPSDVYIDLIGRNAGMERHIKDLLIYDGFYSHMSDFAKEGRDYYTTTDDWYRFRDGDLYWAIHRFTWVRTRTQYDRAYFKIIDTYDFEKWKDIPGIVAGFAGTSDFEIEIYGLVNKQLLE